MKISENIKLSLTCVIIPFVIVNIFFRIFEIQSSLFVKNIIYHFFFLIAFISLVIPKLGNFIYKKLKEIGSFLGKYISIIALFFVYICAVLPTGILMKIVKRDRLRLKKSNIQSYWIDNENKNTNYEYQF